MTKKTNVSTLRSSSDHVCVCVCSMHAGNIIYRLGEENSEKVMHIYNKDIESQSLDDTDSVVCAVMVYEASCYRRPGSCLQGRKSVACSFNNSLSFF